MPDEGNFVSLLTVWIFCTYTIYMLSYLIKYFNEKSPHLQSLLDGFYIQLNISDIFLAVMVILLQTLIDLYIIFKFENEMIVNIISWLFYIATIFNSVFLATSCIARAVLIFGSSIIESIEDRKIWILNGLDFNSFFLNFVSKLMVNCLISDLLALLL